MNRGKITPRLARPNLAILRYYWAGWPLRTFSEFRSRPGCRSWLRLRASNVPRFCRSRLFSDQQIAPLTTVAQRRPGRGQSLPRFRSELAIVFKVSLYVNGVFLFSLSLSPSARMHTYPRASGANEIKISHLAKECNLSNLVLATHAARVQLYRGTPKYVVFAALAPGGCPDARPRRRRARARQCSAARFPGLATRPVGSPASAAADLRLPRVAWRRWPSRWLSP